MTLSIGFDLGGTTMTAALVDDQGHIQKQVTANTPAQSSASEGMAVIEGLVAQLVDTLDSPLAGIGMGVAGLVNPESGLVYTSPNLPAWKDVPLGNTLHTRFGVPVHLDNDVRTMALGEQHFGAGKGCQHMVCLTVGTGVGSALILNGDIYRGSAFTAGEFGHLTVIPQGGRVCGCGNFGCLETVAGTSAILSLAHALLQRKLCPVLQQKVNEGEALTPKLIAECASQGDRGCQEVWAEIGHWIGIALAGITNLLNPERIVIGGGIAQAGELLFQPIRDVIQLRAFERPASQVTICGADLGPQAGVIGASVLARKEVLNGLS